MHTLVVGLGGAGTRFLRALLTRDDLKGRLSVVDTHPLRRKAATDLGVPTYSSIDEIANSETVEVAIVAVPEIAHFGALVELRARLPNLKRVLCEKPLTETLDEARQIQALYSNDEITVNFVERFSPAIEMYIRFLNKNRRKVARINCFWGKYRVKDSRPTTGVVSVELSHAVDLLLFLSSTQAGTPYRVVSAHGTRSDFSTGTYDTNPLDTIDALIEFSNGVQASVHASLLWPHRDRRLEVFLTDEHGKASELAVFNFDQPSWDEDRLVIYDLTSKAGRSPAPLVDYKVPTDLWSPELRTVGKVSAFVASNFTELQRDIRGTLPRLEQGVYVQEILHEIEEIISERTCNITIFSDSAITEAVDVKAHHRILARMIAGDVMANEHYSWDVGY